MFCRKPFLEFVQLEPLYIFVVVIPLVQFVSPQIVGCLTQGLVKLPLVVSTMPLNGVLPIYRSKRNRWTIGIVDLPTCRHDLQDVGTRVMSQARYTQWVRGW